VPKQDDYDIDAPDRGEKSDDSQDQVDDSTQSRCRQRTQTGKPDDRKGDDEIKADPDQFLKEFVRHDA